MSRQAQRKRGGLKSLKIIRYFSPTNGDVYGMFEWERSDVDIIDDNGKAVFTQPDVEFPKHWTGLARKIVASKYFYGGLESSKRENSVKQLVGRVTETIAKWGLLEKKFNKGKYFSSQKQANIFRDELSYLVLNQMMAFNSPVWFNVGVDRYTKRKKEDKKRAYIIDNNGRVVSLPRGKEYEYPQTSACFIQSVEDNMG